MSREIIVIAHNLRSAHNVGSLLRTAEGIGVNRVYLTGYTPYPMQENDSRLPHISLRVAKQINKTALGAENSIAWSHSDDIEEVIDNLAKTDYVIAALEQSDGSTRLPDYVAPNKIALIIGREVEGIEATILKKCAVVLEIPMKGQKESYNVVQAAAMALYHLSLASKAM